MTNKSFLFDPRKPLEISRAGLIGNSRLKSSLREKLKNLLILWYIGICVIRSFSAKRILELFDIGVNRKKFLKQNWSEIDRRVSSHSWKLEINDSTYFLKF